MSKKSVILSLVLTVLVVFIVLIAGPVKALSIGILFDNPLKEYLEGETITLTFDVDINDPDVQLPISQLMINVDGPSSTNCVFMPDGGESCGGEWNVVSATGYEAYGFGNNTAYFGGNEYDFGYGYGYGYGELNTNLHYVIELNTFGMDVGDYDISLVVDTGSLELFDEQDSFRIIGEEGVGLTINNPIDNGEYGERKLLVDVETSEVVEKIVFSIDGRGYATLCRDCDGFDRLISFRDGDRNLRVKAIPYEGDEVVKEINLYVDSVAPRITRIEPDVRTNGYFNVRYNEENLEKVELYYGVDMVELTCESGNGVECSTNVDLSSYSGSLDYYFKVYDRVNSAVSEVKNVLVETSGADILIISPIDTEYSYYRIPVTISLDKEVEKIESSLNGEDFRSLCRNCDGFDRNDNFDEGLNELLIRTTDHSGNVVEESVSFMVDSREPRILDTMPEEGEYVNGEFSVRYTEDNVENVKLYYGKDNVFNMVDLICESGSNMECSTDVDLSGYSGELDYYFSVEDPIHLVNSEIVGFNVDNVDPILTLYSPIEFDYNERRIPISGSFSEVSKFEYSLDGNRFITLCNDCESYDGRKKFSLGDHEIVLKITDYAGNSDSETVSFSIV